MGFSCGIVGLPNVGKSTLFNALTNSQKAKASNYAFCTIEPNKAIVEVPDERLNKIAKIENSKNIIPTQLTFIDIAGLVKNASKGEGLGNKFLPVLLNQSILPYPSGWERVDYLRCLENGSDVRPAVPPRVHKLHHPTERSHRRNQIVPVCCSLWISEKRVPRLRTYSPGFDGLPCGAPLH